MGGDKVEFKKDFTKLIISQQISEGYRDYPKQVRETGNSR